MCHIDARQHITKSIATRFDGTDFYDALFGSSTGLWLSCYGYSLGSEAIQRRASAPPPMMMLCSDWYIGVCITHKVLSF